MRVGTSKTVITPPPGTALAGFAAREGGARGVHDDLYARALVLEDDGRRLALVLCDLL
jgi:neutral ceramidase